MMLPRHKGQHDMQRRLGALITAFALVLPPGIATAQVASSPISGSSYGAQLLVNGSFDRDGSTVGWAATTGANYAVITSGGYDGLRYLRANIGTLSSASVQQDVAVNTQAGQSFVGSIWVKADSGSSGAGRLALWGLGGTQEGSSTPFVATPQWQQIQVPLDTNHAHTSLRLEVYLDSGIQYALDGAQLTPQMLTNASHERAASALGWVPSAPGVNYVVMSSGGHDGARYLLANTGTAGNGSSIVQDVSLPTTAGQSFVATVWVRTDTAAGAPGRLALWGLGGTLEAASTNFVATSQWQQVQVPLDTNYSHTGLRLELYMDSSAQYAIDGAELMPQLLTNASHERASGALGWAPSGSGVNFAVISTGGHDGSRYLRANTGTAPLGSSIIQNVAQSTATGQSFVGSIWVRSESGGSAPGRLALWGIGGTNEARSTSFVATGQWQQIQVSLDTASAHSSVQMELYMDSSAQYGFDGAQLTTKPVAVPPTSTLTNPYPASSVTSGWTDRANWVQSRLRQSHTAVFGCGGTAGSTGHIAGSYHDSGNGLDCWVGGSTPTASEKAAGDAAVNWLVANADALKVQEVIWYGRIWLWKSQSAGWQTYSGTNPHRDHIHVSVARPGDGR
jgi:hypothetical protein